MAKNPGKTMAEASGVRSRIEKLKAEAMELHGSVGPAQNPHVLSAALWRAMRPERSRVQVRAAFLLEQVQLARIEIGPLWRLAGNHLPRAVGRWAKLDPAEPQTVADLTELGITVDEIPKLCRQVQQWRGASSAAADMRQWCSLGDADPDCGLGRGPWLGEEPTHVFIAGGWTENHSIRDYAKLLRVGFAGIGEEVRRLLDQADIAAADTVRKENFRRAALHVCEAGVALGRRYAERARQMAGKATDPADRARLTLMAETCHRVPARGARTCFEAVQALWVGHVLTCGEDGINANSLGRLDQILYRYYQADVAAGRLGRDEAVEIMAELACKLYQDYDVQAIVLGGQDAEGRDVNGVTAMLNSLARMPHNRAAAASAAIVELDEKVIEGPEGVKRLAELIRSAIAMGVGQLQWNVTTADRLRLAQEDPERYGNIAVRVAGFSQMFRLIDRELQDHIIARTKHKG